MGRLITWSRQERQKAGRYPTVNTPAALHERLEEATRQEQQNAYCPTCRNWGPMACPKHGPEAKDIASA